MAASNLQLRLVSGAIMIAAALSALISGGWVFIALLLVVGVLAGLEWARLMASTLDAPTGAVMIAAIAGALVASGISAWVMAVAILGLGAGLLALGGVAGWVRAGLVQAMGLLLIGLTVIAIAWLRALPASAGLVLCLWYFGMIWLTDSAAYFVGRGLGGPKLAPMISPNKTWSGSVGGLAAAAAAGAGVAYGFGLPSIAGLVVLSLGLSALGQASDLAESAMKRWVGVKDSGQLIPGHGGVLDRIDSLLLTAPALAGALILAGMGRP